MSNLRVNNIRNENGSNGPIIDANTQFKSRQHVVLPRGTTAQRPSNVSAGSIRYNTETKELEYFNGTDWATIRSYSPDRAIFIGGSTGASYSTLINALQFVTISTTGDSQLFGNHDINIYSSTVVSSGTRGIFMGGSAAAPISDELTTIEYINYATQSNTIHFGECTKKAFTLGGASDSVRGLSYGGFSGGALSIGEYVTMSTGGKALNFPGYALRWSNSNAGLSSPIRGYYAGGSANPATPYTSSTDIITAVFATKGSFDGFGDLHTTANITAAGCSNSIRGIWGGGYTSFGSPGNVSVTDLRYVSLSQEGNSISFGNLSTSRSYLGAASNKTRGLWVGGISNTGPAGVLRSSIEYVSFSTTGTVTTFGNLSAGVNTGLTGGSDCHGGLQ